jgi:hypothetical protein
VPITSLELGTHDRADRQTAARRNPGREDVKSRAMQTTASSLLLVIGLLTVAGCENHDGNEWQRLVCEVSSVNEGNPLVSAYLNAGNDNQVGTDDDFVPIDSVPVVFRARPYGSSVTIPEDGVYSWFHVTSYDLVWDNTSDNGVDLSPHNIERGGLDAMVPIHDEGSGVVLVSGLDMREAPWFVNLFTGDLGSFQANARLTFYGHESGNTEEIAVPASLRVHFIGVLIGGD